MKIFSQRQPGQAGIIAIIVTTVLFALGISVSSQVTKEVVQNIEREESTQALNAAEGGLETGSTTNVNVSTGIIDNSSILLSEGDSVEIEVSNIVSSNNGNANFQIMWELGDSNNNCTGDTPALLISHYQGSGASATVNYYPIAGYGCTNDGYTKAEKGSSPYRNLFTNNTNGVNITDGRIRIKALFNNTYLKLPGLINVSRSAAQDDTGEQVRVVELRQTTPAAPAVMDYALFAGSGDIAANQ